ncbi:MAG: type I-B CRISPR-associated protein Cas8b/Csh1 [Clostridia bacterium]|jgi:CRISPR-associated protein Csh1|nr:type I-B CRISPR-associated protein Cas8b/Csh1 [Clostridia bacterium]
MLCEAMEVFKEMLQEKGDRIILDTYIPKDGTYRLIEMNDDEWKITKTLEIKNNKKSGEIEGSHDRDYTYIRELDYYSKLLEMNKPMDSSKTIHTNNYLSIAVKKENINKLNLNIINSFYETLINPNSKYKKSKVKALYENVEKDIGKPDVENIEKIKEYVSSKNIWEGIDLTKKNYAKVFFVYPDRNKSIKCYKKENLRYLIPNIYNNNDYNKTINENIYGLPNNNIGMNSKKPYLDNKSRKTNVPYMLNQQDAILQMQLFDYFNGQVSKGRGNIYIDTDEDCPNITAYSNTEEPQFLESGYFLNIYKDKNEAAIRRADVITKYDPCLKEPFWLKNYIEIPQITLEKSKIDYQTSYKRLWEVKGLIDIIFFEGKLKFNLYTEPKDMSFNNDVLKRCLLQSRDAFISYFYCGEKRNIKDVIKRISIELIENSLRKDSIPKARHQFNLRWSLLDYFKDNGRIGEKMINVRESLRKHINQPKEEEWEFSSDEEFAYGFGQAVSYLVSLSKAKDKSSSVINPFLNAKNTASIKKQLMQLYKKYNYQIPHFGAGRIEQLLSHIMVFEPKEIQSEYLMAGFTAFSLIYEKKNTESEEI